MEFRAFNKIPRLNRDCVITEKIDGTNASIFIGESGEFLVGSRNRWITPEEDNYGFARWAYDHREELLQLGPGHHFGEWWGCGIQRRYGLNDKRFSLFNTERWLCNRPSCCHVVPALYSGPFCTREVQCLVNILRTRGSVAAPGFMDPEGIIVYHKAANQYFKVTVKDDESPKSLTLGIHPSPKDPLPHHTTSGNGGAFHVGWFL